MARDVNLVLDSGQTLAATANTTAIDTEGGLFALFRLFGGTFGGTTPTLDIDLEVSTDGGSNYYKVGSMPQLDDGDDDIEIARVAYIPKLGSSQTVTKVRLAYTVTGTSPSFVIDKIFLEPLSGAVPPAVDENLGVGLSKLV